MVATQLFLLYGNLAQQLMNAEHCTSIKTVHLTESHVIVDFLVNSFREWCTTEKTPHSGHSVLTQACWHLLLREKVASQSEGVGWFSDCC